MYRIISSKHFFVNILLLFISILIAFRLPVVPFEELYGEAHTEIYKMLLRSMNTGKFAVLYHLISFIFLFFNVYFFLNLSVSLRFSKQGCKLHGFIFLFLNGIVLPFLVDVPSVLISATLFMIMLKLLFGIFRKQDTLFQIFNIGVLLAISSFFWYFANYFFPFVFIGILILRTVDIREWIAATVGLILPYYLLISVYFFVNSDFDIVIDIVDIINFKEKTPTLYYSDIMVGLFIALLFSISTIKIALNYSIMEADTQDFFRLFFILFLFSIAVFFIYPGMRFSALSFTVVPAVIPIAYLLVETKKKYLKEIFTDLLILLVLFIQSDLKYFQVLF